jgi:hypothetical protein
MTLTKMMILTAMMTAGSQAQLVRYA